MTVQEVDYWAWVYIKGCCVVLTLQILAWPGLAAALWRVVVVLVVLLLLPLSLVAGLIRPSKW